MSSTQEHLSLLCGIFCANKERPEDRHFCPFCFRESLKAMPLFGLVQDEALGSKLRGVRTSKIGGVTLPLQDLEGQGVSM
jgi:hypothetical protein